MFQQLLNTQFMIYIVGGIVSTTVDIFTLQTMISMGFDHIISVTVGFFVGLIINYAFHVKLTFKSASSFLVLIRFSLVVCANYLITIIFVMVSFSIIESVLVGKIVSLPVVAVNGFLLSKYWIFDKV